MKRWTKEQVIEKVGKGVYGKKYSVYFDDYFKNHKTASVLTILNANEINDFDKQLMIFRLDYSLWDRSIHGLSNSNPGFYAPFATNIRKELKK